MSFLLHLGGCCRDSRQSVTRPRYKSALRHARLLASLGTYTDQSEQAVPQTQGGSVSHAGGSTVGYGKGLRAAQGIVLLSAMLFYAAAAQAAPPSSFERPRFDPNKATTSDAARQSAVASIPFERLKPEARRKVQSVLSKPTLFRRMPLHVTECDPELHRFLVRHPDVVVGIWEELGLSDFRMAQDKSGVYQAVEGNSTRGTAEFLYQDDDIHIVYCKGQYRGPILAKPLQGSALLILRTGSVQQADGQYYITSRLDTFTLIDNATVEFLTRTFQPLIGKVVDNNFIQASSFVGSLSRTTTNNYRGVQRIAGKLHRVRPEVRKEFATLARRVAQKASPTQQASHEVPAVRRTAAQSRIRR